MDYNAIFSHVAVTSVRKLPLTPEITGCEPASVQRRRACVHMRCISCAWIVPGQAAFTHRILGYGTPKAY